MKPVLATVLLLTGCFIVLFRVSETQAKENEMSPLEQLKSEKPEERNAGMERIVAQRKEVIRHAEDIIKQFAKFDTRKGTVCTSILLLGKLQAQEAVPLLVNHLTFEVFYKDTKRPQPVEDRFPSVQALIDIGLPSIEPVMERVKSEDDRTVMTCAAAVVRGVLGKERAISQVKRMQEAERDQVQKKKLSELLNDI